MAEGESPKTDGMEKRATPEEALRGQMHEQPLSAQETRPEEAENIPPAQDEPRLEAEQEPQSKQTGPQQTNYKENEQPAVADEADKLMDTLGGIPPVDESVEQFLNNQEMADSDIFGPAAFFAGKRAHEEAHRMKSSGSGGSLDGLIEKETRKESSAEQRRKALADLIFFDMLNAQIAAIEAQIEQLEEEIHQLEERRSELIEQREELVARDESLEQIDQEIDAADEQLQQTHVNLDQALQGRQQLEDTMAGITSDFLVNGQIDHTAIQQAIQEQNEHVETLSRDVDALEQNFAQMQQEAAAGNMSRESNPDFFAKMDQTQAELAEMKNQLSEQQTVSQQMSSLATKLSSEDYQRLRESALSDRVLTQQELDSLGLPQNITPEVLDRLRTDGVSIQADTGAAAAAQAALNQGPASTITGAMAQIHNINEAIEDLESTHDTLSAQLKDANADLDTEMRELQQMMKDAQEANQMIGKWETRHDYMEAHYSVLGWDETESIANVSRDENRILKDNEGHIVYYDPATQELFRIRENESGEKIRENYSDIDPAQIPALEKQAWAEGEGNGKIFGNEALGGEGFVDTFTSQHLGTSERSARVSDSVVKQQNFVQALNGQITSFEEKIEESEELAEQLAGKRDEALKKLEELEANSANLSEEAKKELARQKAELQQKIEELDKELEENQRQIDARREQVAELREDLDELRNKRDSASPESSARQDNNKTRGSAADQYATPGEPMNSPNVSGAFAASAGREHKPGDPTNALNANRDADTANDPVYEQSPSGLQAGAP